MIFGENAAAATRTHSGRVERACKVCAAAVVGVALFAPPAPARADDTLPAGGASDAAIAAAVSAASGAAADQASAIAGNASAAPSQPAPPASSPAEIGSASGSSGGITSAPSAQSPDAATPTVDGVTASAVAGATAVAGAVVAAAKGVVSQPSATVDGGGGGAASAGATTDAGSQYQQNDGRYQSPNSGPISSEIGRNSAIESRPEAVAFPRQNPGRIPAPKCLADLPNSLVQKVCNDALSQLPNVRGVLGVPQSTPPSSGRTHPQRRPRTHPAARPPSPSPRAETSVSATNSVSATSDTTPHVPVVVAVPTASRTATAHVRHERSGVRAGRDRAPRSRKDEERALVPLRPDTPVHEAAGSDERSTGASRTPLFVVALLLGLASVAVALGSLGAGRSAALTAVATRVRSKGLSRAKARPRSGEDAPPGIRYRD
jgi:hypothetical protein